MLMIECLNKINVVVETLISSSDIMQIMSRNDIILDQFKNVVIKIVRSIDVVV